MNTYDAVIVGGGHNGLVTACYLQKAGLDVVVVEKNDWVGGAAVSRSLTPGLSLFELFLCLQPVPPGNHAGSRTAEIWASGSAL